MAKDIETYLKQRAEQSQKATDTPDNDPANVSLDRQYNEQFCLAVHHEDIALVPINRLRAYAKHPFKVYSDDKMTALMESIARDGLQHPIVVRKVSGVIGWEILSGHNRVEA